jgi:hypothetical protein
MAFLCRRERKYWYEDPDYDEGRHDGMTEKYRVYRLTERRIGYLRKQSATEGIAGTEEEKHIVLEAQVQQVILWLRGVSVVKAMNASSDTPVAPLQQLELIVHALSLRKLMAKRRISRCNNRAFQPDELASAMGVQVKALSTRKKQEKAKREAKQINQHSNTVRWNGGEENLFRNLVVDQELAELCRLPDARFVSRARVAILEAMKILRPSTDIVYLESSRRKKKTKKSLEGEGPLNQKLGKSREPWKNGFHLEESSDDDWSSEDDHSNKRRVRWKKSKAKVSSRRAEAIDRMSAMS